jgi:hypothetical protein
MGNWSFMVGQRVAMQRIYEVGWKDLSHEVWFGNVHKQMIQLKGDIW